LNQVIGHEDAGSLHSPRVFPSIHLLDPFDDHVDRGVEEDNSEDLPQAYLGALVPALYSWCFASPLSGKYRLKRDLSHLKM
jgi:hypothetical protein